MKVRCIDNKHVEEKLTINKIYDVLTNDKIEAGFYKERFKIMYSIEEIKNGKFAIEIDNEKDWLRLNKLFQSFSHFYGHCFYAKGGYGLLNEKIYYEKENYTVIKFNQIKFLNMEKKPIGYKLIKPEYKEVALKIVNHDNSDAWDNNFKFGGYHFTYDCIVSNKLKEAGVLDLWFEKVYEEEFKVGDWVYIENTEQGAFGAKGKVGTITDKKGSAGLSYAYPDSTVKVEVGNSVWVIGKTFNSVKLRLATSEEIESAQTVIISMTASNGDFEIEVNKDKIYYRPDNKTLAKDFIEAIINSFVNTTNKIIDDPYKIITDTITVGCKVGTLQKNWKKVLDAYNSFN